MEKFDKPYGAIHNGQVMIKRLEEWYNFKSQDIHLMDCAEWDYLKRCFDELSKHVESGE